MNVMKKIISFLLATAMITSLAACSSKTEKKQSEDGDKSSTTTTKSEKPADIKWLTTGDAAAKPIKAEDRIISAINEKLGIKLNVQIVPEGNIEKVNVAMASGDLPDVVTGQFGTSATQQWIDDGMIIPLNDYLSKNSDLKKLVETDYPWTAIDGKYYGAPFITQYQVANSLIVMRQDWLDKVGMKYPETLDEMKAVLKAFTENDPDGNGKKDTFGYTAEKPSGTTSFDWVFFAYGAKNSDYAIDANGNVIPWFEGEFFKPSMTYIKDLMDSGYIDNEIMLNNSPKKEEKFYQGRSGAMLAPLFRHVNRHEKSVKELFPTASISYGLPPKGPNGDMGLSRQGKNGMITGITSDCKNPDKAASFINYMVSEEGNNLLRLGIEATHYTKNGDTIVFNEEERAKDAFAENGWAHALAWGSFYWPLESNYIPANDPARDRALETVNLASKAQIPNLVKQKTPLEIKNGTALNDIFVQYFSDMLQGKISIDDGVSKLSKTWKSEGGDQVLAEVTEVYKASKK